MKECHTPRFPRAIITQYFFEVMGLWWLADKTLMDSATFHLWMKERHTHKFPQVSITLYFFAVMGGAVACGAKFHRQCNIPSLKSWYELLTFASASCRYICDSTYTAQLPIPDCVLQMNFVCEGDAVVLACLNMVGCEVLRLNARRCDLVSETHQRIARELVAPLRSVRAILPEGRLLSEVWQANPFATLADLMRSEEFGAWYCAKRCSP